MTKKQKRNNRSIYSVLNIFGTNNKERIDLLSEDKSINPYIIFKWLTGSNYKHQVVILNEIVNKYLFSLQKEKKLLYYLLMIGTEKGFQKYKWYKKPNESSLPLLVIKEYFNYNNTKAKEALKLLNKQQIIELGKSLRWDDKRIEKLKEQLDDW